VDCSVAYAADVVQDEDGRFLVTFVDFEEAATDGETLEEALDEAVDCLDEVLAARIVDERDIPVPSASYGRYRVVPSVRMAAKALLYVALQEARLSKTELARRLACDEKKVRRLLDPACMSRIDHLEAALQCSGRRFILQSMRAEELSVPQAAAAPGPLQVKVSRELHERIAGAASSSDMSIEAYCAELLARAVEVDYFSVVVSGGGKRRRKRRARSGGQRLAAGERG